MIWRKYLPCERRGTADPIEREEGLRSFLRCLLCACPDPCCTSRLTLHVIWRLKLGGARGSQVRTFRRGRESQPRKTQVPMFCLQTRFVGKGSEKVWGISGQG